MIKFFLKKTKYLSTNIEKESHFDQNNLILFFVQIYNDIRFEKSSKSF